MEPPWRKYPEIPAGSIGWRMGYGEDYRWDFYDWFSFLPDDERAAYMAANPAPEGWRNLYKTIIENPSVTPPMSPAERTAAIQKGSEMLEEINPKAGRPR